MHRIIDRDSNSRASSFPGFVVRLMMQQTTLPSPTSEVFLSSFVSSTEWDKKTFNNVLASVRDLQEDAPALARESIVQVCRH